MDYDADGDDDIITGSYTGEFYLFRSKPNGTFAQRELLTDEDGKTLMMPFDSIYSVVPELVDIDADGDLDIVVGARTAAVQIVTNLGTRSKPLWSKTRRELQTANGNVIKGSNAHHADWDGDGVPDLLVGSEWGEVRWYRNLGSANAPKYADGLALIERSGHERGQEGSTPKRPGQRVKVHVTDWNGDGRADLLVGDVTWQQSTPNPLTPAEAKAKEKLDAELSALWSKIRNAKGAAKEELEKQRDELRAKLRPYERTKLHTHGWVWLYLRDDASAKGKR